jgi:glycerophosphoryl diester phosphodiesterase
MTPGPALPAEFLRRPIAHRGFHDRASGRIENSRAALRAAAEAGYAVEIDLQLSADGEAMVFHDAALDRLTPERGALRERSAAELGRIPLSGGGETIPTLAEILALAGDTPLLVEIKDQGGRFDATGVGPLEARAAALLAAHPGPVAVMSFNPEAVAAVGRATPALPRGLTSGAAADFAGGARAEALARLADVEAVGAAFVSYAWRALPTPETAALRARGVPVLCWTVRSPEEERAARRHADGVTFEGYAATLPR